MQIKTIKPYTFYIPEDQEITNHDLLKLYNLLRLRNYPEHELVIIGKQRVETKITLLFQNYELWIKQNLKIKVGGEEI